MAEFALPDSIQSLTSSLYLVNFDLHGVAFTVPKFAIYAIIPSPVFQRLVKHNGKTIAMMRLGRYDVPVVDPISQDIDPAPKYVVIVSMFKEGRFGLYGHPADHYSDDIQLPLTHNAVSRLRNEFG
ncbi:hypothetical protein [Aestuariibacter salexigens]|uniref:hypothetical protein n=1 Tax=Aestuariibacter salexigens TaxID=226010 RepID=UPI00047C96C8|nr:hypothetical protein [Aestuariibacter salexigens]